MINNIPKSLIDSVQQVMNNNEKARTVQEAQNEKYFPVSKQQPVAEEKLEEKTVSEKLVGNQHKLDHNKNNKIDAHDFKLMRAKKKTEGYLSEPIVITPKKPSAPTPTSPTKPMGEEVKAGKKVLKAGFWDTIKRAMSGANPMNPNATYGSTSYQTTRREEKDTPGQHSCAVHVKHAKLGEGKTLTTQHADPAEDGSIAWYDVMFEHGIEKKVPTTELEILEAKHHKH